MFLEILMIIGKNIIKVATMEAKTTLMLAFKNTNEITKATTANAMPIP